MACVLMKSGVPFNQAFSAPDDFRLQDMHRIAMYVVFGELEGGTFNWNRMRWEEQK